MQSMTYAMGPTVLFGGKTCGVSLNSLHRHRTIILGAVLLTKRCLTGLSMQPEVAKQFAALWESSDSPPDVFTFLQQHQGSDAADILAVLLQDQRHRWQTDQPLKVEAYLAHFPDLADDPDCQLNLAVGEFQARQNGETSPDIAEFASRFADIRDSLRIKLSALASASDLTVAGAEQVAPQTEIRQSKLSVTFLSDSAVDDTGGGRYRPERVLGEGAFGRVYLAFDEELQRQVAIKVPTDERFKKPEDAEQYLAEARTVASLDHPNIVPVYDTGRTDDGSIYVVSKFIEGRTLRDRIKQDRPNHDEAATLLATVAQALHHAHERRIIHRDVKPGNILIEDSTARRMWPTLDWRFEKRTTSAKQDRRHTGLHESRTGSW